MFDGVAQLLQRAMGGASERHDVIAHNIANVNTPHYQRQDVDFLSSLRRELGQGQEVSLRVTHPSHQGVRPEISRTGSLLGERPMRNDGNTVDIEGEMAELTKNSLYYNAVARQLGANLSRLRTAITEGRR